MLRPNLNGHSTTTGKVKISIWFSSLMQEGELTACATIAPLSWAPSRCSWRRTSSRALPASTMNVGFVEDDPGLRKVLARPFNIGDAHIHRDRLDLGGIAAVPRQRLPEPGSPWLVQLVRRPDLTVSMNLDVSTVDKVPERSEFRPILASTY